MIRTAARYAAAAVAFVVLSSLCEAVLDRSTLLANLSFATWSAARWISEIVGLALAFRLSDAIKRWLPEVTHGQ